jgi:hypothetical protein
MIVIGVMARTGSAVAVALSGTAAAPRFRARREIELVPPGLGAQPYHAAASMDLIDAGELIAQTESAAEKAAAAGLRTVARPVPSSSPRCRPQSRPSTRSARPPGRPGVVLRRTPRAQRLPS